MSAIVRLYVRMLTHLWYRANQLRSACCIAWLKCRGVKVGRGCYVGRWVGIHMEKDASLTLGDRVYLNDHVAFFIGVGCSVEVGDFTYVGRYCEIACNTDLKIGRHCAITAFCTIHGYQDPHLPVNHQPLQISPVVVEDEVWLGYKATILRGVRLGKHAVVGANFVVTCSVPPYHLAAGVPARVLKEITPAAAPAAPPLKPREISS
jgi:acetyltransferase-like isoleucine patch superfamily enzyme